MRAVAFSVAALIPIAVVGQLNCPGYKATNIQQHTSSFTADLDLASTPCNVFGTDLPALRLTVEYQTESRLHVIVEDRNQTVYQVPNNVFVRPVGTNSTASRSQLHFNYTEDPFAFSVRRSNGEVLFDTSGASLIFESQYLYLRTALPDEPNIYGLGEHSDPFKLNATNYTRTMWTRDAYGAPPGSNLYGAHPVYVDHRGDRGTHAVLLLNSNGMDVKIDQTGGQHLEYHILGGVFDFYFVAGPSPVEVSEQIAQVVGLPAMIPYAGLGFHQCRYGYRDVYQVAEVVHNYSIANIPLETMWTDIDYMELRRVFSLDPERFPLAKVRELVDYLHAHQQHYTVMVDPAVAYTDYDAFNTGRDEGVFLTTANGSIFQGVVWPGVSAFPDWFNPQTQAYWEAQFGSFFNRDTGVDIDFLWIDMNEPANFCDYPCSDAAGFARQSGNPPAPPPVRDGPAIPLPGFPADFQPNRVDNVLDKRQTTTAGSKQGLPGRNLIDPPYQIQNAAGSLSNRTASTNLVHYNGLVEYDTHNLYGTMMSNASRHSMLSRRPGFRPLIITRSTFLGAGTYVGHWLGDNISDWPHYRVSISQMMQFTAIYQIPMVGADVCGFGGNTTETLCARWMMLGAFYPFYRNHNEILGIPQEAYRWESVAAAARYAIDIRYRLMDYFYTAFLRQTQTGRPALVPLWYAYPSDTKTFAVEHQFLFGDAILVSPVTEENSTSVTIYLPDDIFYDWNNSFAPVRGHGELVTLENVGYQNIPLHVRGGSILPLRVRSANTTTELRKQGFRIVIAPGLDGNASGSLYLDEGSLLEQPSTTVITMNYSNGTLSLTGSYGYAANVVIEMVTLLGAPAAPTSVISSAGEQPHYTYNDTTQVIEISTGIPLTADVSLSVSLPAGGNKSVASLRVAQRSRAEVALLMAAVALSLVLS